MRKLSHWLFAALILTLTLTVANVIAQEYTSRRDVFQDEALRRDFNIQGEYLATISGINIGLHVIADGGGKFRTVVYVGGLPGDGWRPGGQQVLGTAQVEGDTITFNITEIRGGLTEIRTNETKKGKIIIVVPQRGQDGGQGGGMGGGQGFRGVPVKIEVENPAMTFEKQFRQSPTLNGQPPAGAVVLFDGTNVDKFEPGAKINEMPQRQGGGQNAGQRPAGAGNTLWAEAVSKPFEGKPYKMHIEFMLSYMPQARGQARSNSGVYLDERYECQVLDSFGLDSKNDDCGGFYQVAAPTVNMCFPPLTWQTYDFDFTPAKYNGDQKTANARVTVKHNGVVIHDNIELPKETPGRKAEGANPLGVYLQGHGNKVQYRNIWVQYK